MNTKRVVTDMTKSVGIIGDGVIGGANKNGFEHNGHNVKVHDIKYNTSVRQILECEAVFVCVPTPMKKDGSCDVSIVEDVVRELSEIAYPGVICIRSTCVPGTTQTLIDKYENNRICFSPEFLRERCAAEDFIENHQLLAIGTQDDYTFEKIKNVHGNLPKSIVRLAPTEAELLKYYNNVYNSVRIIFANYMFEICQKLEADYDQILNAYLLTQKSTGNYLSVNENLRGFGGMCLPKDTAALSKLSEKLNIPLNLISTVIADNDKLEITVFEGMRK